MEQLHTHNCVFTFHFTIINKTLRFSVSQR